MITVKLEADALIMLTNVDGLMRRPSEITDTGVTESILIDLVTEISSDLKMLARGHSLSGRGGMVTKLEAAEIAMRSGAVAVIANGGAYRIAEVV